MTTATQPDAIFAAILLHLNGSNKGAVVAVGTMTNVTIYKAKHVTMFRLSTKGDLQVQHGRSYNTLAQVGIGPLVSIRLGVQ